MDSNSEEIAYSELSQDQKAVMRAFAVDLFEVVSSYGISPSSVGVDDLHEEDILNNRVWSVVEYYAFGNTHLEGVEDDEFKADAMLQPGLEVGALSYHVARSNYSEEKPLKPNPYTSLLFVCTTCNGGGCQACYEEGELIYMAFWDDKNAEFRRE